MKLTIDEIMKMSPCKEWNAEKLREFFGEEEIDLLTIFNHSVLPFRDKLWFLRKEVFSEQSLNMLAEHFYFNGLKYIEEYCSNEVLSIAEESLSRIMADRKYKWWRAARIASFVGKKCPKFKKFVIDSIVKGL